MVIIMISVDVVKDQGNRDWARGLTLCMYTCVLTLLAAIAQAVALRFYESNNSINIHELPKTLEKKIIPVFQVKLTEIKKENRTKNSASTRRAPERKPEASAERAWQYQNDNSALCIAI